MLWTFVQRQAVGLRSVQAGGERCMRSMVLQGSAAAATAVSGRQAGRQTGSGGMTQQLGMPWAAHLYHQDHCVTQCTAPAHVPFALHWFSFASCTAQSQQQMPSLFCARALKDTTHIIHESAMHQSDLQFGVLRLYLYP